MKRRIAAFIARWANGPVVQIPPEKVVRITDWANGNAARDITRLTEDWPEVP